MSAVKKIYEYVKLKSDGASTLRESDLLDLFGATGIEILRKHNLLEDRGYAFGDRVYKLRPWKDSSV